MSRRQSVTAPLDTMDEFASFSRLAAVDLRAVDAAEQDARERAAWSQTFRSPNVLRRPEPRGTAH